MRLKRVQGLGELFGMLVGGAGSGRDGVAEGRQSKGFSRCASSFAMMRCHFEKRGKEIELLPLLASILLACQHTLQAQAYFVDRPSFVAPSKRAVLSVASPKSPRPATFFFHPRVARLLPVSSLTQHATHPIPQPRTIMIYEDDDDNEHSGYHHEGGQQGRSSLDLSQASGVSFSTSTSHGGLPSLGRLTQLVDKVRRSWDLSPPSVPLFYSSVQRTAC